MRKTDTRQIEYILAIAEEKNITHAAEKLHLTQPALNQQLLRLERELGMPLFVRSRTDWHLTPAGEVYLETAKKMLLLKKDCYLRLEEMAKTQRSTLHIGFTPGRETRMFAEVYPKFHSRFPDTTVIPVEKSVAEQVSFLKEGKLDMGFIAKSKTQELPVECRMIAEEELMAVVPAGCLPDIAPEEKISLSLLAKETFALITTGTTLREFIDRQFEEADFSPNVLFESTYNDTILQMVSSGICCGLIPSYYKRYAPKEIKWFRLENTPFWEVDVAFRKGEYLTKAAKEFANLAAQYWNK